MAHFSILITLLLLVGAVSAQVTENITIAGLPNFATCQPAVVTWSGGSAPYRVYIYPEGWTNQTDWIVELPLTTRTQQTWNVNLAAGSGIVVNVWDGVNDAYSEPTWIQDSGDSSCLAFNGTFQSTQSSEFNTSLPTPGSISSTRPSVISTPSPSVTPTPATVQASDRPSAITSSSEAAPATVTVVQGNGASSTHVIAFQWPQAVILAVLGVMVLP